MEKSIKQTKIRNAYDKLLGISEAMEQVEVFLKKKLINFICLYGKELYIECNQGVPHMAMDFTDENADGEPKIKRLCGLSVDGDILIAKFEDGTESRRFSVDDLPYIVEDIYIDDILEEIAEEEEQKEEEKNISEALSYIKDNALREWVKNRLEKK